MNLKNFQWNSLKSRVTLLTLIIFVVSIWSLALIASEMLREEMERMQGEQQFTTAITMASEVNHEIKDRFTSLTKIADEINLSLLNNPVALQTYLVSRAELIGLFNAGVISYNADGTAIAESQDATGQLGENQLKLDHIAAALKQGLSTVSKPHLSMSQTSPEFCMAIPIRDAEGEIIGALAGVTDLNKPNFLENVTQNHYGKTGGYLLIDKQTRTIITATDKSRIMEILPPQGTIPGIDKFMHGYESYTILTNPLGVNVLSSAKGVTGTNWYVAVMLPVKEAFAPIITVQRNILFAALIFTLFAGGLTWWMLGEQLAPILTAIKTLTNLNDSPQQIPHTLLIDKQDEIGKLLTAFNRLLVTLNKREKNLQESEDRYHVLVDKTPSGFIVHHGGKVLYVNPAAIKMFGAKAAQDLIGMPILNLIHPSFHQIVLDRIKKNTADGIDTPLIEEKFVRLDGSTFAGEITGTAIIFNGEPAIQASITDITERKAIAEQLHRVEEQSHLIVQTANEGIFVLQGGHLKTVNPASSKLSGYSEAELLALPFLELVHNDDRELVIGNFQRRMKGEAVDDHYQIRIITKQNQTKWIELSGSKIKFDGQPASLGFATDITERKNIESWLSLSEANATNLASMLRMMCDNVPDMIWAKDLDKNYIFANKAICEHLLGAKDTNEPIGKNDLFFALRERNHFPDNPDWHTFGELCQDSDDATLNLGKTSRFEEFGNVKGKYLCLDVFKAPFVNDRGEVIGVVGTARDITLQKAANEKLQLAAMVFENSSEGMMVTNADNLIIETNPAFTKLTGYDLQEVIGNTPTILNSGEQSPDFYLEMWQKIDETGQWQGEIWNRRKDGGRYVEWLTINSVYDESGSVQRRVALFSDITMQKQAEAAIQFTNRALAARNAVNRSLMHTTHERELFQEICQAIVEKCGYVLAWVGYVVKSKNKEIRPVAQFGFEEGYLNSAKIVWADTPNGQGTTGRAVRLGSIQIAQNLLTDETMAPWRDEALKRGYASCISLPLATDGQVFGVMSIYAKQAEAFSKAEAELLEEMANDLTFGVTALHARQERDIALQQLSSTANELAEANSQIELERAQLSERVTQRTAQLLFANKAKDSFLATMSHEIRTPLGGLLGMIELLGLSHLNQTQREILMTAQDSGASLLRIVDDVLDWSKIEAGKLELSPKVTTIVEMMTGVKNTYLQLASEKGLHLNIQVDGKLASAHRFDPLRLSQILNNFASNAIKFTNQGRIDIHAKWLSRTNGQDEVEFSVKDTGIGIDAAHQARLFELYEQANADTARMYGGTGLGLSICRSLADMMHGQIGVLSVPDEGSTFSIKVNLEVASSVDVDDLQTNQNPIYSTETESVVRPLVGQGTSISVLVVDDHPINRALLKKQLLLLGLQVTTIEDGTSALSLWENEHFDLIISDCHMPDMDGYELARRIRTNEQLSGKQAIPIIAWTANVLTEELECSHAAGMNDLLTKPTKMTDLRAMLLKWLTRANILPTHDAIDSTDLTPQHSLKHQVALNLDVLKLISARPENQLALLKEFNLQNRIDIANLDAALQAGNASEIMRCAHRIKGASRMVGAVELEGVCTQIEQVAKQNDIDTARLIFSTSIESVMTALEAAISTFSQNT
jgi:PAS domain S-box-containing protein